MKFLVQDLMAEIKPKVAGKKEFEDRDVSKLTALSESSDVQKFDARHRTTSFAIKYSASFIRGLIDT